MKKTTFLTLESNMVRPTQCETKKCTESELYPASHSEEPAMKKCQFFHKSK